MTVVVKKAEKKNILDVTSSKLSVVSHLWTPLNLHQCLLTALWKQMGDFFFAETVSN